ncbi:MAG: relaxase/mobilization nuclease domain-containing protein [Pseudomonadota bacterium]
MAQHLLKDENEHVEVHELRGFASDNLTGALNEMYALSRGTQCKKFMYSLSLNPPPNEKVTTADFEEAIERVEEKLGLNGQARATVFHEKNGRRHAHCVWSRINTDEMKAIHMPFDQERVNAVARELFIKHGWDMPRGFADRSARDPKSFTLAEWQQAKRVGKDARAIKTAFQDAWAISDSKAAFTHALDERGYKIARGDRRGFVAVDMHGEVYSIPKWTNVKTKDVRTRLGDEQHLPSLEEAKRTMADDMLGKMQGFSDQLEQDRQRQAEAYEQRRATLVEHHQAERQRQAQKMEDRQQQEACDRQARFRKGLAGLWDRLRGEHKRISERNAIEAQSARDRDQALKEQLIQRQLEQRRRLNVLHMQDRERTHALSREITTDAQRFAEMRDGSTQHDHPQQPDRKQRPRNRGPSLRR